MRKMQLGQLLLSCRSSCVCLYGVCTRDGACLSGPMCFPSVLPCLIIPVYIQLSVSLRANRIMESTGQLAVAATPLRHASQFIVFLFFYNSMRCALFITVCTRIQADTLMNRLGTESRQRKLLHLRTSLLIINHH